MILRSKGYPNTQCYPPDRYINPAAKRRDSIKNRVCGGPIFCSFRRAKYGRNVSIQARAEKYNDFFFGINKVFS